MNLTSAICLWPYQPNYLALLLISITVFIAGYGGGSSSSTNNSTTTTSTGIISTAGGTGGDTGTGGNGQQIIIYKGVGSGPVEILKTGSVDASFTPITATANLGTNPATVTIDTVLSVLTAEPASGTLYLQTNSSTLYQSDGDGTAFNAEEQVTGLHIAPGATLTLNLNYSASSLARFDLANDLHNEGTIKTVDINATSRGHLYLQASSYIASGNIDTAGRLEGQHGGNVNIIAINSLINHGDINAAGMSNPKKIS